MGWFSFGVPTHSLRGSQIALDQIPADQPVVPVVLASPATGPNGKFFLVDFSFFEVLFDKLST